MRTPTEPTTPTELARQLRVPVKTIRAWLRTQNLRPDIEKGNRWILTSEHADAVRQRFASS
ncbi:MAG: helix-turn-helix domain-containing protein [Salinibacterium sp.]|nr:helix-turn-helix domain-containing protein [Salinibacterium sp.]